VHGDIRGGVAGGDLLLGQLVREGHPVRQVAFGDHLR
jgi:hypothetical protein